MASHLTLEEREVVAQSHAAGSSQRAIARKLGRSPSTISRELRRNRSRTGYFPARANELARQRRRERPLLRKMQHDEVRRFVCDQLKKYHSPDQIAGRAKLLLRDRTQHVSRQTIYAWIKKQAAAGHHWQRYLRRHGKRRVERENRGRIPNATSIEGRPKIAERRGRKGDFEGDTVRGLPGRGGLLTLVDRKTRLTLIQRVSDLKAETVKEAGIAALRSVPRKHRKTVTFDNGKEFAEHKELSRRTGVDAYFAKPHCSWQRGTNENTNGLIRQFFPKGSDIARESPARINQVQDLLNNRPRRCLGYRTPREAFTNKRPRCI
jgi:IS30 family transposase